MNSLRTPQGRVRISLAVALALVAVVLSVLSGPARAVDAGWLPADSTVRTDRQRWPVAVFISPAMPAVSARLYGPGSRGCAKRCGVRNLS